METTPRMHRHDITFGLELEFLTQSCDGSGSAYHAPTRNTLAREILQLTRDIAIAAECDHDIGRFCAVCMDAPIKDVFPGMRVYNAPRSYQGLYVGPRYGFFFIQKESLVCPSSEIPWRGIEITTPVFNMSELFAGLPQTKQVMSALRQMDLKVAANRSCGLHIHVGLAEGLRLIVAKKLVTLVMLLERPLIRPLCPESRKESPHTSMISERSRIVTRKIDSDDIAKALVGDNSEMNAHWPWKLGNPTPTAWSSAEAESLHETMRLVWHASSLRKLAKGLCKTAGTRTALAICLRGPTEAEGATSEVDMNAEESFNFEGSQSTFEFRYPQMSFDVPFIQNWVELCCKMVDLALLDAATFKEKLMKFVSVLDEAEASDGDAWGNILAAMELSHQIPEWREQLQRHARGEDISHLGEGNVLLPESSQRCGSPGPA